MFANESILPFHIEALRLAMREAAGFQIDHFDGCILSTSLNSRRNIQKMKEKSERMCVLGFTQNYFGMKTN